MLCKYTSGREIPVRVCCWGGSVEARVECQGVSTPHWDIPLAELVTKAAHECVCWAGLFLTEKAGFPFLSLDGIVYLPGPPSDVSRGCPRSANQLRRMLRRFRKNPRVCQRRARRTLLGKGGSYIDPGDGRLLVITGDRLWRPVPPTTNP